MHKLKIGDLVCFNSGGMRHKTLGIVMDFDFSSKVRSKHPESILIMWAVIGKYMPRQCWTRQGQWQKDIGSGDFIWHEMGNWFMVVK